MSHVYQWIRVNKQLDLPQAWANITLASYDIFSHRTAGSLAAILPSNEGGGFRLLEISCLNEHCPENSFVSIYFHRSSDNNSSARQSAEALKTVIICVMDLICTRCNHCLDDVTNYSYGQPHPLLWEPVVFLFITSGNFVMRFLAMFVLRNSREWMLLHACSCQKQRSGLFLSCSDSLVYSAIDVYFSAFR
jgi:hypothetical protein